MKKEYNFGKEFNKVKESYNYKHFLFAVALFGMSFGLCYLFGLDKKYLGFVFVLIGAVSLTRTYYKEWKEKKKK